MNHRYITIKIKAMKKLNVSALLVACCLVFSCAKEHSGNKSAANIITNRSSVKPGESVLVSVGNSDRSALAKWTVTPVTGVVMDRAMSWDQKNEITFNQPGTYNVQVELWKVWCDSAAAANPGMDTCLNGGTRAGKATAVIQVKN
jgi:hypothetical protein